MSLILRDPLFPLLCDDYALRPYRRHQLRPVRVHRYDDWPITPRSFDQALDELQTVMDTVNDAIGNYQSGITKDLMPGGLNMNRTEDGHLQLALDVAQYKPEEINVRVCDGNLVVEAKSESSENNSYHKSEFKRWIKLPEDVKQEAIKSTLTGEGKLVIDVPANKPIENSRSRSIPVNVQKPAVEDKKQDQNSAQNHQQKK